MNNLRGIDARCEIARARVLDSIDLEAASYRFENATYEAECQGINDYIAGETNPPGMFFNEPELLDRGWSGHDFALDLETMRDCPMCQNKDVGVCTFHQ